MSTPQPQGVIARADDLNPACGVVAVVGAPSTTTALTLNVLRAAYARPLYGQMVAVAVPTANPGDPSTGWELAMGTVTSIETTNAAHTARAPEATHVATQGRIASSGGYGDTRTLAVSVEAVFRWAGPTAAVRTTEREWLPAGTALSTSPATGTSVRILDQDLMDEIMRAVPDQRFVAHLHGTSVHVPWTGRDFTGSRGAQHDTIIGATGSGKTSTANWLMAADLFHDALGQIIFDPQGQWSTEHGVVFSLQGLAAALGRKVTVARLSRSLRLDKDAGMLADLLIKAGLLQRLTIPLSATDQMAAAATVIAEALRDYPGDWTEAPTGEVLVHVLTELRDALATGVVYAGKEGANRVRWAIARPTAEEANDLTITAAALERMAPGVLDECPLTGGEGGRRWDAALATTVPLHNLFSPLTPTGATMVDAGTPAADLDHTHRRTRIWPLLSDVFNPPPGAPAPWLILDLSVDAPARPARRSDSDVDDTDASANAWRALDDPGVKARIMRRLLTDLTESGLAAFKDGRPLNTRVTFDEAWQYAGPTQPGQDRDVVALSDQLAAAARDVRKIGIGLRFITQAATSIREDIWKQLASRVVGWGLTEQTDMRRLANIVGDTHMSLYNGTAGPEATGRYMFMVTGGGATGLSFGARPVFIDMYSTPAAWLNANTQWITDVRRRWAHLLPAGDHGGPLTTMPARPTSADAEVESMRAIAARSDGRANAAAASRLTAAAGQRTATLAPRAPVAPVGVQQ